MVFEKFWWFFVWTCVSSGVNYVCGVTRFDRKVIIQDEDRRAAEVAKNSEIQSDPNFDGSNVRGLFVTSGDGSYHSPTYHSEYPHGVYGSNGPVYNYGHQEYAEHYYPEPNNYPPEHYPHEHHAVEPHGHGYGYGLKSILGLKGFLIPLAGIALLGAAAALATNPVLLQLGVVNGRRRRRDVQFHEIQNIYPPNHLIKRPKNRGRTPNEPNLKNHKYRTLLH